MKLNSPDFEPEGLIPDRFTCEGEDLSPQLNWTDVPEGTRELALVCDDPDAPNGTFTHWTIRNLSPSSSGLRQGQVPGDAVEGGNDFGRQGWGGPCPPKGHGPHRYYFRLYALDFPIDPPTGFSVDDLRSAMQGHILAEAEVMGRYEIK